MGKHTELISIPTLNFYPPHVGMISNYVYLEYLGQVWARRLHAILASPLLLLSTCTNLYFLTGIKVGYIMLGVIYLILHPKVGHIFARRVLLESWPWGLPTILSFLYCGSQVVIEVKNYESRKMNNNKQD